MNKQPIQELARQQAAEIQRLKADLAYYRGVFAALTRQGQP